MRLDLGVASYGNPVALRRTLDALKQTSKTDWRCLIVSNAHPDSAIQAEVEQAIKTAVANEPRFAVQWRGDNIGYAGAVNEIFKWAETPYVGYMDNDAVPLTDAWDLKMVWMLTQYEHLKAGMVFPSGGCFPIVRPGFVEILWGLGFCWIVRTDVARGIGGFDTKIGHQEEVDFQTRLRLAGWKIVMDRAVNVEHAATSSNDPAAQDRINKGVMNWVNKWCRYFGGEGLNFFSPNVLRFEDWPPTALYMEEYWLRHYPEMNRNPETITHNGQVYDLIKVPRVQGMYRERIIQ
jgi:GT2 family glycosyltransferase